MRGAKLRGNICDNLIAHITEVLLGNAEGLELCGQGRLQLRSTNATQQAAEIAVLKTELRVVVLLDLIEVGDLGLGALGDKTNEFLIESYLLFHVHIVRGEARCPHSL